MEKDIYICNTVYQVLVALWIKYTYYNGNKADIIVSDHMNNGEIICERLKLSGLFDNCYYCKTKKFCFELDRKELDSKTARFIRRHPEKFVLNFIKCKLKYNRVFLANADKYSQLFYDACCRKKRHVSLYLFEDGLGTYSTLFKNYYEATQSDKLDFLHKCVHILFNKKCIYGNVSGCYLFNPKYLGWESDFPLIEMKKIDLHDDIFVKTCNFVFDYNKTDNYNTKYIFMEESFFADGLEINDLEIVEKISDIVGKNNIMIKIHPRNPVNRFKKLGYKTNSNTSIPWEVIIMNNPGLSKKVLIAISSTSVLNPFLIFGMNVRVLLIYQLIKMEKGNNELWDLTKRIISEIPKNIYLIDSLEKFRELC